MKWKIVHKVPTLPEETIRQMIKEKKIVRCGDMGFLVNFNNIPPITLTEEQIENLKQYPKIEVDD